MSETQKVIYEELTKLNVNAGKAYIGALKVIKDLENPDRFSQSANSIRHLSGIISREISVEFNEKEKTELEDEFNHSIKEKSLDQLYYAKIYVKEKSLKERLKIAIIEEPDKLPSPVEKRINLLFKNWLELHDFFHAIAHYGDIRVDQNKFEEKLYEFENLLLEILNNMDKLKTDIGIEELKNPISEIKKEIAKFISKFLATTSSELNEKDANLILEIIKKLSYNIKEEHLQYKEIKEFNRYVLFYYKDTAAGSIFELIIKYLIYFTKKSELAKKLNLVIIKDQIKEFLNPDYEYPEVIRSIISSHLYHLFETDEMWCKSLIPLLFLEEKQYRDLWNISWESFIIGYPNHVYYKAFKHLIKVYDKAIDKLTSPNISYDIKAFLTHHIIIVYLNEKVDLSDDSLVVKFFNVAFPELTAEIMRYCTVNFYDTIISRSKKDEKRRYIKLIINLWKYRIEHLENFSKKRQKEYIKELQWFLVLFKKLEEDKLEFLQILNAVLELSNGKTYIFVSDVIERLKSYLELDFEDVVKAILEILKSTNLDWFNNRTEQFLIEIFKEIYEKYDYIQIKEEFNKIIDILTKNGYYDFKNFYISL